MNVILQKKYVMTYKETAEWLFKQLPFYQRDGKKAYKANLDNTIALDNALGNPHKAFKTIHIAGTNGKGSTSHILASILMEAGYSVGLYTSPHLKDFTERIMVDSKPIDQDYVVKFVASHQEMIETMSPSFFELTVAMAFSYFADKKVDYAVIETGLGGRLDSTNIITPELAVITNISMDHADLLGTTLSAIAAEKAGIIKREIATVIGRADDDIRQVFEATGRAKQSPLIYAQEQMSFLRSETASGYQTLYYNADTQEIALQCPLMGIYQQENVRTVYVAAKQLATADSAITETAIRNGIANVQRNMPLRGRWETLSLSPLTVCDTAHNYDGVANICQQLAAISGQKHIVWGMVGDKDVSNIIPLLPADARYYLCAAGISRAMPAERLAEHFKARGLNFQIFSSPLSAMHEAQNACNQDGIVFVGGSTFVVAEII